MKPRQYFLIAAACFFVALTCGVFNNVRNTITPDFNPLASTPKHEQDLMSDLKGNVSSSSNPIWEERLNAVVGIFSIDKTGQLIDVGSGWFVKGANGLIMTDLHVLDTKAKYYKIILKNGKTYKVDKIVWSSEKDDIARLQINTTDTLPSGLTVCTRKPEITEDIWIIGHPLGMPWSIHKGIIASADRENIDSIKQLGEVSNYIELDTLFAPGMSGGPVITRDGCVIGQADFIFRDDNSGTQLAYAIKNDRLLHSFESK